MTRRKQLITEETGTDMRALLRKMMRQLRHWKLCRVRELHNFYSHGARPARQRLRRVRHRFGRWKMRICTQHTKLKKYSAKRAIESEPGNLIYY